MPEKKKKKAGLEIYLLPKLEHTRTMAEDYERKHSGKRKYEEKGKTRPARKSKRTLKRTVTEGRKARTASAERMEKKYGGRSREKDKLTKLKRKTEREAELKRAARKQRKSSAAPKTKTQQYLEKKKAAPKSKPKPTKAPRKPAPKKAEVKPKPTKATKPTPKPKKIPKSGSGLEKAVRGVGRKLLHGKSLARIVAKVIPGLGTAATVHDIGKYLKDRYKEGIASGRIEKPTLTQIREAKKKAKATAAKKKGYAKTKKVKDKVTKKKKVVGTVYKRKKPTVIKARKKTPKRRYVPGSKPKFGHSSGQK